MRISSKNALESGACQIPRADIAMKNPLKVSGMDMEYKMSSVSIMAAEPG
jgi:hypothetical protein